MPQVVVVEFVHQREQSTEFASGESFARKPAEVMSWQVRDEAALVFPVRHLTGGEEFEGFRCHCQDFFIL